MLAHANVCIIFVSLMTLVGCAAQALEDPERKPAPRTTSSGGGPYDFMQNTYGGWSGQPAKGGASNAPSGSAGLPNSAGGAGGTGANNAIAGAGGSGTGLPAAEEGAASGTAGGATSAACPSLTLARLSNGTCVPRVREYDVAEKPTGIVLGSDGRIWVDDDGSAQLLQLDDSGQVIGRVRCGADSSPRALAGGTGDAVVWYTGSHVKTLVKVRRDRSEETTALGFDASALAQAENGDLFLTEFGEAVYRLRAGETTPTRWEASPTDVIVVTPDRNVWFSEGSALGQLVPDAGLNDFSLGESAYASGVCVGPDSGLWFSDGFAHQLTHVSLEGTSSRTINLPTGTSPGHIIVGPDGALWFTETGTNMLGRVTLNGQVTHYPLPTPDGLPYALAAGSDGNIWFTTLISRKVGRLIPDPAP